MQKGGRESEMAKVNPTALKGKTSRAESKSPEDIFDQMVAASRHRVRTSAFFRYKQTKIRKS
jgi:hypothetical protein